MPHRALGSLATACLIAAPAAGQTCPYDFSAVDQQLQGMVSRFNLAGCSLQVAHDHQVLFQQAYGRYSLETAVPIASASKWMSSVVVMSLVDQNLLHLDDTTGQWLGWTGLKGTITIRQLMSHTSGIATNAAPCLEDDNSTLQACAAAIYSMPLIGPPGGQFAYGGNSMQVAGRICELAGGKPFTTLFAERVTGPLDLAGTHYNSETNPRVAGGITSTLGDYGRFMRMILNRGLFDGILVLSPQSVDLMLADQTNSATPLSLPPCAPEFRGYGVGNWILAQDGAGQSVQNASPGAFKFTPWIDRDRDISGVFLTLTVQAAVCPSIDVLRGLVADAINAHPAGDLNCDHTVNLDDLLIVLSGWGPCPPLPMPCPGDVDANGEISVDDLLIVLMNWS